MLFRSTLRPLDLIKPYRMEFDTKLPDTDHETAASFWRKKQSDDFIIDVKNDQQLLINLASMDVQPAFDWKRLADSVRIITPEFKVYKNNKPTTIVIYAKMARGQMCRYIIKNRITDPEELKHFEWEGFRFEPSRSTDDQWLFLQT